MDKIFNKSRIKREIRAISSKSEAHRALICAALADNITYIECTDTNADIDATASCLNALGAKIERTQNGFTVEPILSVTANAILDCNESGSTLRFMLPLAAALGADCELNMRGRLASRPLSPLYELLCESGIKLSPQGQSPLSLSGRLRAGEYSLAANISSQFISGMLFALSIAEGDSLLRLCGKIESAPYIEMTVDTLKLFGADVELCENGSCFKIKGKKRLISPKTLTVGGDWSNAAFFLSAGAIGNDSVTLSGLNVNSRQGDRAILSLLEEMGAKTEYEGNEITVIPQKLHGIDIDASQIPDLVPILATVASVAEGKTTIYNASRLRLKESDRIESVCSMLSSLGADITPTSDGMVIVGKAKLSGGVTDSFNDHRIAMSAAIASLVCCGEVRISRFEAINKSYSSFPENFE